MPTARSSSSAHPLTSALLLAGAIAWGLWRLVESGRVAWPPHGLLASLSTLAGCIALVGPLILLRSGELNGELGELAWMTAGILIWICDLEAIARGQWRTMAWATPLSERTIGVVVLAVLIAGWKCGLKEWKWSWTNLTGWLLAMLWIGVAASSWMAGVTGRATLAIR